MLFALDHLGGEFKQQVLYLEHKGGPQHMSYRQLCKLTKAWELRGWLTAPADAVSAATSDARAYAAGWARPGRLTAGAML